MPPIATQLSPKGLAFIKQYQGFSQEKYQDADELWIIGYGHLIRDGENFDTPINLSQAEVLLRQDVQYYQRVLFHCLHTSLEQNQYDALMSLAFSLGPEAVQQSTIMQCINQRDFGAALAWWQRDGEQRHDLALQRQAECELFRSAIPAIQ